MPDLSGGFSTSSIISNLRNVKHLRIVLFIFFLLLTVLLVFQVMSVQESRQRASGPLTAPVTPVPTAINWKTSTVALSAKDFSIIAGGKTYRPTGNVIVSSDPGSSTYTTLEVKWSDKGVEMRMNMYFVSQLSGFWRLTEVRTYNGQTPGEWIYYTPTDEFDQPIQNVKGNAYVSSQLRILSVMGSPVSGEIQFKNVSLLPFIRSSTPTPSRAATPTPRVTLIPTRIPTQAPKPTIYAKSYPSVSGLTPGTSIGMKNTLIYVKTPILLNQVAIYSTGSSQVYEIRKPISQGVVQNAPLIKSGTLSKVISDAGYYYQSFAPISLTPGYYIVRFSNGVGASSGIFYQGNSGTVTPDISFIYRSGGQLNVTTPGAYYFRLGYTKP